MAKKSKNVHILVNESYFKNFFEPERKKCSKMLGINLSQQQFTHFLFKVGASIKYDKRNPINNISDFFPKNKRKRKNPFSII